jgi:hypothetical protein
MTDTPRRFKDREDYSPDEQLAVQQARHRGEPEPRFETDEYKQARREHLEAGGFEPDGDQQAPTALEDMTPDDHYQRIRREQ